MGRPSKIHLLYQQVVHARKKNEEVENGANPITSTFVLQQILPDAETVLYLDTDHVILSNVTELWEYFEDQLRKNPFAVMARANHIPPPANCSYHFRDIPYFGNGGRRHYWPDFDLHHRQQYPPICFFLVCRSQLGHDIHESDTNEAIPI